MELKVTITGEEVGSLLTGIQNALGYYTVEKLSEAGSPEQIAVLQKVRTEVLRLIGR